MNEISMKGCRPMPLTGYLKALGVLRLLAEQADQTVKGWWEQGIFKIRTSLTPDSLMDFFKNQYRPTPIVSPWNGGSGFYENDNKKNIQAILESSDTRFEDYQKVVREIKSWPEMPRKFETVQEAMTSFHDKIKPTDPVKQKNVWQNILNQIEKALMAAEQDLEILIPPGPDRNIRLMRLSDLGQTGKDYKSKGLKKLLDAVKNGQKEWDRFHRDKGKNEILDICRQRLPEKYLSWFDACVCLLADGSPGYNWLLGSGGNDGRLEFGNNFSFHLTELFLSDNIKNSISWLKASLFEQPTPDLIKASIGRFDPGRAGGFNQGNEVETKNFKINPWDFVLAMEGAVVFSSSVVRRHLADTRGLAALPFTVPCSGVGFTSSQHDEAGQAEVWAPIWGRPTGFFEVRHIFKEGRRNVGRREAQNGLDFSRSISTLGVDRGLDSFFRYTILKRRGDSHVAFPAGQAKVTFKPAVRLLDQLDPLLYRLDGFLKRFKNCPTTFSLARKQIDEAMFQVSTTPDPARFIKLVSALGQMEKLLAQRDRSKSPSLPDPLSGLTPEWVIQCDDGQLEVRLAAALASIRATESVGPIRANLSGVSPNEPWKWAKNRHQHSWAGSSLDERLAGVLTKRLLNARQNSTRIVPLESHLVLSPWDIIPFLTSRVDDQMIENLLWGFMWLDWRSSNERGQWTPQWTKPITREPIPRAWALLKLLFNPQFGRKFKFLPDSRIPGLLKAGRLEEACGLALRRLDILDLHPLPVPYENNLWPQRMLASLLFPVSGIKKLKRLVLMNDKNPD